MSSGILVRLLRLCLAAQDQRRDVSVPRRAIRDVEKQVKQYGSLAKIPAAAVGNTRNDMYLVSEALRLLVKDKESDLSPGDITTLNAYKQSLDGATKFIPTWVKVAVAIALGLGTMIGWKRIVITVGEKIGKSHLTYGQGAAAELVAAGTIAGADMYGFRFRRRMFCRRVWPERCWPTAPASSCRPSAISY